MEKEREKEEEEEKGKEKGKEERKEKGEEEEKGKERKGEKKRVISAVTAVQVVAIEAWGRREGEQLRVDKAQWAALVLTDGTNPRGISAAGCRLRDGVPTDEDDFMPSYLAPVLRLSPRSAGRRYESARVLVG